MINSPARNVQTGLQLNDDTVEYDSEDLNMKDTSVNWNYNILSSDEPVEYQQPETLEHEFNIDEPVNNPDDLLPDDDSQPLELSEEEIEGVLADGTLFNSFHEDDEDTSLPNDDFDFTFTPGYEESETLQEPTQEAPEETAAKKPEAEPDFFEDQNDEGPIALSDDELEFALSDSSTTLDEEIPPTDILQTQEPAEHLQNTEVANPKEETIEDINIEDDFDFSFTPEDESATAESFSPDEELVTFDEPTQETSEEPAVGPIAETPEIDPNFFEDQNDEGPIALSDDELEFALSDSSTTLDEEIPPTDILQTQEPAEHLQNTEVANPKEETIEDLSFEDDFDFSFTPEESATHDEELVTFDEPAQEITEEPADGPIAETPEIDQNFFEDQNDEGPIALSDDELEFALSDSSTALDEEIPPIDILQTQEPAEHLQETGVATPKEETIEDINIEDDFDFSFTPEESATHDEELVTFDEPTQETSEEPAEGPIAETPEIDQNFFEDQNDEGPIALSDDELEFALADSSTALDEEIPPTDILQTQEPAEHLQETEVANPKEETIEDINIEDDFDFSFTPEEESATAESFSPDEELVTFDEPTQETSEEPAEEKTEVEQNFFEDQNDEGPIALSDDELEFALSDSSTALDEEIPPIDILQTQEPAEHLQETEIAIPVQETIKHVNVEDDFDFSFTPEEESATAEEDLITFVEPAKEASEEPAEEKTEVEQNFFEDQNDEGPIALSDDELEFALADSPTALDEEIPPTDISPTQESAEHLQETEIAIPVQDTIEDVNTEDDFDFSFSPEEDLVIFEEPKQDTPNESTAEKTEVEPDFFEDQNDEGPIALSDDELEFALADSATALDEEIPPTDISPTQESAEHLQETEIAIPEQDTIEDINIDDDFDFSFTPKEEAATAESFSPDEEFVTFEEPAEETSEEAAEEKTEVEQNFFEDQNDEGPIALSDDELENVFAESRSDLKTPIDDTEPSGEEEDIEIAVFNDEAPEPTEVMPSAAEDITPQYSTPKENIAEEDYEIPDEMAQEMTHEMTQEDFTEEIPVDLGDEWDIEDTSATPSEHGEIEEPVTENNMEKETNVANVISDEEGKVNFHKEAGASLPNRDELKKVVAYLDNLLGELPDELIEKFAKSEYFKLYQKVMEDLGL